jgi:sulfite reductase alpha subunit-like flavoprotein
MAEPGFGDDGTPNGGVFYDLDQWIQNTLLPTLISISSTDQTIPSSSSSSSTSPVQPLKAAASPPVPPPYRVTVHQPSKINFDEPHTIEEWQQYEFHQSYLSFFQKQAPITAYEYNHKNQRCCPTTTLTKALVDDPTNSATSTTVLLQGRVVQNDRITASDWEQDTRHICIQIGHQDEQMIVHHHDQNESHENEESISWSLDALPYRAGDVASILPTNSPAAVSQFLKVLPPSIHEIADCVLDIQSDASMIRSRCFSEIGYAHWPRTCTLRGWLTYCADIHALPEREDLRALSSYCSERHARGNEQKEKLMAMSETKASALYADYVLREKRNWTEVLYDFDSLREDGSKLTVEVLLGLLSPIRPREFSIASSPTLDWLMDDTQKDEKRQDNLSVEKRKYFSIELCVAVVEGTTRLGRKYHGLCSKYLGEITRGSSLRMWIRPGSFQGLNLEVNDIGIDGVQLTNPVLLVGAGTGVAPLRGMILEREAVLSMHGSAVRQPNTLIQNRDSILVFGCRKESADFYYAKEWRGLEQSGGLGLLTAFSRDQWHKIYVQQVIAKAEVENRLLSRVLIERNGSVYIAGGPKMARAVKDTIVESLAKSFFDDDEKRAQQFLTMLQRAGRLSIEAWS